MLVTSTNLYGEREGGNHFLAMLTEIARLSQE